MFWDSSAVIPYLVAEAWSREATEQLSRDEAPVLWWSAAVECRSALERRKREGRLSDALYEEACRRLDHLCERVDIVEPHALVRDRAFRLLSRHPLRAADALQLAAALTACDEQTAGEAFVCLDARLRKAASEEGFRLIPEAMPS